MRTYKTGRAEPGELDDEGVPVLGEVVDRWVSHTVAYHRALAQARAFQEQARRERWSLERTWAEQIVARFGKDLTTEDAVARLLKEEWTFWTGHHLMAPEWDVFDRTVRAVWEETVAPRLTSMASIAADATGVPA
jgi:hypothetical protein